MNSIFCKMFDRTKHGNWFFVKRKAFSIKRKAFSVKGIPRQPNSLNTLSFPENSISKKYLFSRKYFIFRKSYFPERKMYSGVWLCRNLFYGNQFRCLVCTNILRKMSSVLRKINSHVWFGQTFYKKWNSFFTENQFPCLVCGSFYGKYEMSYKFKHLHY